MNSCLKKVVVVVVFLMTTSSVFAGFNFSHETSTVRLGKEGPATFYLSQNILGWKGTLEIGSMGAISNATSKIITMIDGVLDTDGVRSRQEAIYRPGGTYEITLEVGQHLYGEPGKIIQSIKISSIDTKIEGQPHFNSPLVFDADATTSLGLKNRLNQNIQFDASGTNTIYLVDDLSLADDVTIVNDGTIDVNGNSFGLGGKHLTLANTIYWYNAGDIRLWNRLNLAGTWKINNETTINGNGNVLDISGGGIFDIAPSTTLHLIDVVLMGFQNSSFAFGNNGSTIRMTNVDIQLIETVTHNSGLIYIDGPGTVILPDYNWVFTQDSQLTISGVTLWKDEAGKANPPGTGEVIFGSESINYDSINYGTIKEMSTTGADVTALWDLVGANSNAIDYWADYVVDNSNAIIATDDLLRFIHGPRDYTISSNMTLSVNTWMSNDHIFTIGADLTINGDNHAMSFAKDDSNLVNVGSNLLTFENIVLKDFSPKVISVLSTGTLRFGDGTTIEMPDDDVLSTANYTMTFEGLVKFNCFGHEFDISLMQRAMDVLPSATLVIHNARIKGLGGTNGSGYLNNLRCIGSDSTLTFSDCELMLEDNYSFTQGYINIHEKVQLRGPENPSGTSLGFIYQSPQFMRIKPFAELMIDHYVTFTYDPVIARKDLIVLEDDTSILHFNGCHICSTETGLQLSTGRLKVEDRVTLCSEATVQDEAIVFKDSLDIDVLSGGVLDLINGLLEYTS